MTAPTTPCAAGRCNGSVRCQRHAAEYAVTSMAERGMASLAVYDPDWASNKSWFEVAVAVSVACKFEAARWMGGWDHRRQVAMTTVWVPTRVAPALGLFVGRVSTDSMIMLCAALATFPGVADAMNASWQLGGRDAVVDVLDQVAPGLLVVRGR